jgi:hypothetical protein
MTKSLRAMPGFLGIETNYLLNTAKVRHDPDELGLARIKAAMR